MTNDDRDDGLKSERDAPINRRSRGESQNSLCQRCKDESGGLFRLGGFPGKSAAIRRCDGVRFHTSEVLPGCLPGSGVILRGQAGEPAHAGSKDRRDRKIRGQIEVSVRQMTLIPRDCDCSIMAVHAFRARWGRPMHQEKRPLRACSRWYPFIANIHKGAVLIIQKDVLLEALLQPRSDFPFTADRGHDDIDNRVGKLF